MGTRIVKLPDVGEGVAEAEIVEWHVAVGDSVLEDQVLAAVMTDKATVEIPTPVALPSAPPAVGSADTCAAVALEAVRVASPPASAIGRWPASWRRRSVHSCSR